MYMVLKKKQTFLVLYLQMESIEFYFVDDIIPISFWCQIIYVLQESSTIVSIREGSVS